MTVTFSFWQLAMFAGLIVLAAAVPLWLLSRLAGVVPPAVSVPGRKGGVGGAVWRKFRACGVYQIPPFAGDIESCIAACFGVGAIISLIFI